MLWSLVFESLGCGQVRSEAVDHMALPTGCRSPGARLKLGPSIDVRSDRDDVRELLAHLG